VHDNAPLVTILYHVVPEEARRTVMKLVKMETILPFNTSLSTFFNPHVLNTCNSTMHDGRVETNSAFSAE
jgi:hypothetical protein